MTTDRFHALCAELADELHGYKVAHPEHDTALLDRARALLAAPVEPVGPPKPPTKRQILKLAERVIPAALERLRGGDWDAKDVTGKELLDFARAVLTRYAPSPAPNQISAPEIPDNSTDTPVPVAVEERLPGDEDVSDDGHNYPSCWFLCCWGGEHEWHRINPPSLTRCYELGYTHWLPHHAIPTPEAQS